MKKDAAIATYVDNDRNCLDEVKWLSNSWAYSGSSNRSDLLLFYNPSIPKEKLPKEGYGVIHIPLTPICDIDPLWRDYRRVNNTWFLTTPEAEEVHKYKYTLRTDVDCFLTPKFNNFYPRLATFGINMYATVDPEVGMRINRLCLKYDIKPYHMNADCHVFAHSEAVTEYAKYQYEIVKRLKMEEFSEGSGDWPHWYEYVINMYSAGIAANGFFGMGFNLGGLNVMSMCNDPMGSTDYHIHAWHTAQHFSKILWRKGVYDCLDFNELDDTIISSYCIKMAGKRGVE